MCKWSENDLSFIALWSPAFDCASARSQITELYTDITNLPINKILGELLRSKVILDKEKEVIETISVESKRMEHLLDKIILPSLRLNVPVKYKRFLEVMERNEDVMFTSMAQRLGMYVYNECHHLTAMSSGMWA